MGKVPLKDDSGHKVRGDLYRAEKAGDSEVYDVFVRNNHVGHLELSSNDRGDLGRFPDYKKHTYIEWIGSGDHLKEGNEQDTRRGDCKYEGVGTAMLQVAFERSMQKGYKGRIGLYALEEARGFYLKNGFTDPENGGFTRNMALGKQGRRRMLKVVKHSPLLPRSAKRFKRV